MIVRRFYARVAATLSAGVHAVRVPLLVAAVLSYVAVGAALIALGGSLAPEVRCDGCDPAPRLADRGARPVLGRDATREVLALAVTLMFGCTVTVACEVFFLRRSRNRLPRAVARLSTDSAIWTGTAATAWADADTDAAAYAALIAARRRAVARDAAARAAYDNAYADAATWGATAAATFAATEAATEAAVDARAAATDGATRGAADVAYTRGCQVRGGQDEEDGR